MAYSRLLSHSVESTCSVLSQFLINTSIYLYIAEVSVDALVLR